MSASPAPQAHPSFLPALETALKEFLASQRAVLADISPDAVALVDRIVELTEGGKRLRPLFAHWGARAAGGTGTEDSVVRLGAALELFQAAALIHDDVIDHSDTRRGGPSVHRRFEALHRDLGWDLDAAAFGEAAAILAGDLALSMSEQLFATCSPTPSARALFDAMRTQVMAGQYLDVLEEQLGSRRTADEAVAAARTVVRYKSAKYSVENPVLLGAAQIGADEDLMARLSEFALPLGEAFQLRDDELGVYGDPATTGKPAGDDLREGKRTLLVALALRDADAAHADRLRSRLGDPGLDDAAVAELRTLIEESGAFDEHERSIERLAREAFDALDRARLHDDVAQGLAGLGSAAVRRRS